MHPLLYIPAYFHLILKSGAAVILKSGAAIWSVLARKVDPGVLESWSPGERIGPRAAYLFTMLGS